MGTSNSNKGTRGKGTPLIPTWLGTGNADLGNPPANPDENENDNTHSPDVLTPPNLPQLPPPGNPDRYKVPRTNFSRFVSSGGKDSASLRRAVSGYISGTTGSARNAVRSMGSSRVTSVRLLNFLSSVAERGVQNALQSLKLQNLVGHPIEEIFIGLADYVCPEGGTMDAGIARDAFIQTIADLAENGVTDLNTLNLDQIQTVFELYATHAIEWRLYNEIGQKAITLSVNQDEATRIEKQLNDFIKRGVADALTAARGELEKLTQEHILEFVDNVYEQAFTILIALGN
jgi:hypothetical protein